jgi:hypothetical protein
MTSNGPQNLTGYPFGGSGNYTASSSTGTAFGAFDKTDTAGLWVSADSYVGATGVYGPGSASTSGYNGEWLELESPTSLVLNSYVLSPRKDKYWSYRSPVDFRILGSKDNVTWSLVDSQTAINWPTNDSKTFNTTSTTKFLYFRLAVGAIGVGNNGPLTLSEWTLYGSNASWNTDFYADERGNLLTAPVTGTTLQNWLGGATGYVTKWYDQSGTNHAIQDTAANQPIIQKATKGPGYSTLWPGLASTRLIYGTSSNLFDSTNYSVCVAAKRTAAIATTTYYAGTNGQAVANQNLGVGYSNDTTLRLSEYGYSLNAPTVSGYAGVSEPLGYDFFTFSQTSGMRNYTRRSGTSASNSNTTLTTPLTRSGNSTIGGTNDSASFTGEIYELLVFTQSLYDLDTSDGLITQIYQNQLSYTGT